ncbi:MAG: class I adenylate-forming enzyme family protein [Steroidobacteraceae bacterium]
MTERPDLPPTLRPGREKMTEQGGALRIDAVLTRAALSEPGREALVYCGKSWTYAEVYDRACRLAAALESLEVGKGERVAFWAENRPEFVETLFGVPMLGAISSPLNHWWTWSDATGALEQIRPKVLIVGANQGLAVAEHRDRLAAVGVEHVLCLERTPDVAAFPLYEPLLKSAARLRSPTPAAASDPALILFTSGSTGRSKGAVHTHGSLVAGAALMALELGLHDGERTLHFLPLFTSCLEHLIPLTLMRATHIVLPQFDAAAVWTAIQEHNITHFDAVPTTLRRLLEGTPSSIPKSLRLISYASEAMPAALITALLQRMPGVEFVQFYGMTEQLCLTILSASDQLRKIGTVGRPMLGVELRIVGSDGKEPSVGESGEIIARGPTLFAGYWQDEAATAQIVQGEWLRTGDMGRFDAGGFLVLEGRLKEMIKSGGLTVIPAELEGVLTKHPNVRDVAVIGVPDEKWGEAVHAFVTLSPGARILEADLQLFCREHLAAYKRPKRIHIVAELPTTGIGKVARRVVLQKYLAKKAGKT